MKKILKLLPITILLSFVITCVSMNVFAAERGDVDSDGQIIAADALLVLKHAAKISTADEALSDINKDGVVDATDALWILKYAARLVSDFSDETLNATPVPTATPVPVAENIETLKNHIKTNGIQEESIYYIGCSLSADDTMAAFMVYYADEDLLQMEFSYYEETAEGAASMVELYMPLTGANTYSIFYVGYASGDYYEYLEGTAPINIRTITKDTLVNYIKTDSYNIDDSNISTIFTEAASITKDSLILWNELMYEEVNLGLKDLGFSKF